MTFATWHCGSTWQENWVCAFVWQGCRQLRGVQAKRPPPFFHADLQKTALVHTSIAHQSRSPCKPHNPTTPHTHTTVPAALRRRTDAPVSAHHHVVCGRALHSAGAWLAGHCTLGSPPSALAVWRCRPTPVLGLGLARALRRQLRPLPSPGALVLTLARSRASLRTWIGTLLAWRTLPTMSCPRSARHLSSLSMAPRTSRMAAHAEPLLANPCTMRCCGRGCTQGRACLGRLLTCLYHVRT